MAEFKNPLEMRAAPDPFMTYDPETGYYYALFTCGNRLELYRSRHAANILTDKDTLVVFRVNEKDGIYGCVWAPEMHKAPNGKWYIYTSGSITPGDGQKRLFVMESLTADPFDGFIFKGKLDDDLFAIDPTIYTDENGKQYICYSHSSAEDNQRLEIREMANPYTFGEKSAVVAVAEYPWELVPPYIGKSKINEGAFFVKSGERLFIIYSGNGCWSNDYCLGVVEYKGGDMCSSDSWVKHPEPIFVHGEDTYGPGHASFFKSPDGKELWCAYHVMLSFNEKAVYAPRYFCIQKVDFDETGYPVMGKVPPLDTLHKAPSGEIE